MPGVFVTDDDDGMEGIDARDADLTAFFDDLERGKIGGPSGLGGQAPLVEGKIDFGGHKWTWMGKGGHGWTFWRGWRRAISTYVDWEVGLKSTCVQLLRLFANEEGRESHRY